MSETEGRLFALQGDSVFVPAWQKPMRNLEVSIQLSCKMDVQKLHKSIFNFACVSYSRSGGPGGQNVNKVNTKVTLRLKIDKLEGLTEGEFLHLKSRLASRISTDGELIVQSSGERLQSINERAAFRRLETAIISAAGIPKKRRPTRPTKASKENRLKTKKINGLKKNSRQVMYDE